MYLQAQMFLQTTMATLWLTFNIPVYLKYAANFSFHAMFSFYVSNQCMDLQKLEKQQYSPFYKPSAIPRKKKKEKLRHCINFGDTHGPETKYQIFFGLRAERCIILYPVNSCSYSIYQVAQFILDDCIGKGKGSSCRIVCTQPRRISAISVCFFFCRFAL